MDVNKMGLNPLDYIVEIATGVVLSLSLAVTGEAGDGNNEYMFDRPNFGCSVEHPPEGSVVSEQMSLERGHPVSIGNGDTYSYYTCWFNSSQVMDLPLDVFMYGASPLDAPDTSSE